MTTEPETPYDSPAPTAPADGAGAPGIVVSPAMIAAGVAVFDQMDLVADGPALRSALEAAFLHMLFAQQYGQ